MKRRVQISIGAVVLALAVALAWTRISISHLEHRLHRAERYAQSGVASVRWLCEPVAKELRTGTWTNGFLRELSIRCQAGDYDEFERALMLDVGDEFDRESYKAAATGIESDLRRHFLPEMVSDQETSLFPDGYIEGN